MAFSSFAASITRCGQEEKLNFAKLSIKKTKGFERFVIGTIRVLDGWLPGNRRMFAGRT
jgi:hypothetical protein